MKKSLVFVMTLLAVFSGVTSAWAGGGESVLVDAERTARAFLNHDVVFYTGDFGFTRVYTNGATLDVYGHFELQLDGYISSLTIGDEVIVSPSDDPIGGLPSNTEGSATNFWLGLSGWDDAKNVIYGSFNTRLLKPGDLIAVTLQPGWEQMIFPYTPPSGANWSNLRLRMGDNEFVYDSFSVHGFEFWYDPTGSMDYEIVDTLTGVVYERGSLEKPVTMAGENIVSLQYLDQTTPLFAEGTNCRQMRDVPLDSQVVREGVSVPAKVFFARTFGNALYFDMSSASGKKIEVREWRPIGEEMPVIVETDFRLMDYGGGYGKVINSQYCAGLQVPAGYDRLVVTIIGNDDTVVGDTFYLYAYLGYGGKG